MGHQMEQPKASGRTIGDAVIEVLSNWKLIVIVLGSIFIAFLSLFIIIIYDSEPGSTITVFGLKYERTKLRSKAAPPENAPLNDYIMPTNAIIAVDQQKAVPILDGSLSIEPYLNRVYHSDGKTGASLGGASIGGPNISKIKIASRSLDGRKALLSRPANGEQQACFGKGSYIEIEYRGRYFSIRTDEAIGDSMKITVRTIHEPTLELIPVAQLPTPSGGD